MITKQIAGHSVKLFDSIDELPIKRFHLFNKYMLIDSGIGGDMQSIDNHIGSMMRYIEKKDLEKALVTLTNLRQNLYFVLEQTNPKLMSFVCLVESVDGKIVIDLSDEGIKEILKKFEDQKRGFIYDIIDNIKKKLRQN